MTQDQMEKREEGGDQQEVGEALQSQHFQQTGFTFRAEAAHCESNTGTAAGDQRVTAALLLIHTCINLHFAVFQRLYICFFA